MKDPRQLPWQENCLLELRSSHSFLGGGDDPLLLVRPSLYIARRKWNSLNKCFQAVAVQFYFIIMASISPSPPFSTRKAVSRSFYMVDHNTGRSLPTRSFLTLIQVSFQLLIFGFSLQKSFDLHRDSSCSAGIACICSKILKLKTERISYMYLYLTFHSEPS